MEKGNVKMIMLEDDKRLCAWEQEQLGLAQTALEQMPKIKVRGGKEYTQVSDRVIAFRRYFPGYSLTTNIVEIDESVVVVRAAVLDILDRERASDYAEEIRTQSGVNSTSALENCATSAIGRALAAFGLPGGEYASADELVAALSQQGKEIASPKGSGRSVHDDGKADAGDNAPAASADQQKDASGSAKNHRPGSSGGDAPVSDEVQFMDLVGQCQTKAELKGLMTEWRGALDALPESKLAPIRNLCNAKMRKLK